MGRIRRSAGLWGPGAFVGAAAVAARRERGYSHIRNHISGLAAHGTRSASIMVPGFIALGVAGLSMETNDAVIRRVVRLAGITTLTAGVARCSTPECPAPLIDDDVRPTDVAHAAASIATFACWVALPVLSSIRPGRRGYRRLSTVLAASSILGFVAAGRTTRSRSDRRGLAQRAFLVPVFTWYAATSIDTLRRSR